MSEIPVDFNSIPVSNDQFEKNIDLSEHNVKVDVSKSPLYLRKRTKIIYFSIFVLFILVLIGSVSSFFYFNFSFSSTSNKEQAFLDKLNALTESEEKLLEGDYDLSLDELDLIESIYPDDLMTLLLKITNYSRQQDFNLALEYVNKINSLYNRNSEAHRLLGFINKSKGEYHDALRNYSDSVIFNDQNDKTYSDKGYVYFLLGDHPSAIENYKKALNMNPNNSKALLNLAIYYIKNKNNQEYQFVDISEILLRAKESTEDKVLLGEIEKVIRFFESGNFDLTKLNYEDVLQVSIGVKCEETNLDSSNMYECVENSAPDKIYDICNNVAGIQNQLGEGVDRYSTGKISLLPVGNNKFISLEQFICSPKDSCINIDEIQEKVPSNFVDIGGRVCQFVNAFGISCRVEPKKKEVDKRVVFKVTPFYQSLNNGGIVDYAFYFKNKLLGNKSSKDDTNFTTIFDKEGEKEIIITAKDSDGETSQCNFTIAVGEFTPEPKEIIPIDKGVLDKDPYVSIVLDYESETQKCSISWEAENVISCFLFNDNGSNENIPFKQLDHELNDLKGVYKIQCITEDLLTIDSKEVRCQTR